MDQIYDVFKSFIDPIFVIFILLLISLLVCLITGKKKSGALFIFLIIVLLYGFSIEPVSNYLSYKLERDYIKSNPTEEQKPLDVIVVLGGGAYDIQALGKTFPTEMTVTRLAQGIRMFEEYHAKYFVCSGNGKTKMTQASVMAQMAEAFGVPKERIRIEAKSSNTYEHAVEFNKMFIDKDIRVGLVTSAFHMKRSEIEFRKYFRNLIPLPASYLYASPEGTTVIRYIPQSQRLLYNSMIFREYIGRLWYKIQDR